MKSSYQSIWPKAAAEEVSVTITTLTGDPWLSLTLILPTMHSVVDLSPSVLTGQAHTCSPSVP